MAFRGVSRDNSRRPGLLLFCAPVDHPHRDAVCATLAWIAADEGLQFECYYEGRASGVHFGGGVPWRMDPADLRGGTFSGGRHLEQLAFVLDRFACQAACLGASIFDDVLSAAAVPVRARSGDVVEFYRELFESSPVERPAKGLAIGGGGAINLVPYACHEVVQRKVVAITGGDHAAAARLAADTELEQLWAGEPEAGDLQAVARRSLEMAAKWKSITSTYLIADPEAAGRWIPSAVRNGWAPVYGIPQAAVIRDLSPVLAGVDVVWGRQQDDSDFRELSCRGVAFQLIDPGRPPFPVVAGASSPKLPPPPCTAEPDDDELRRWARSGEIVTSLVFWSGMVRELECLYVLTDLVAESNLFAGLALTTESLRYFDSSPLALLAAPAEQGGLRDRLEVLIASAGAGGMLESEAPPQRFEAVLRRSVASLHGSGATTVRGWWAVMDAPLVPRRIRRVSIQPWPPSAKVRYRPRPVELAAEGPSDRGTRRALRSRVRDSPLGRLFEPIRPFDGTRPGPPQRSVLQAVRSAGFEYALTKSEFGAPPTVATGVDGLTVINYTAGRWDGWTPFETINRLSDLERAERTLRRAGSAGWLLGGLDACLWAFSGHVLDRGRELRAICRWVAGGGSSGRLHNVTPHTMVRYARILAELGLVRTVPVR